MIIKFQLGSLQIIHQISMQAMRGNAGKALTFHSYPITIIWVQINGKSLCTKALLDMDNGFKIWLQC